MMFIKKVSQNDEKEKNQSKNDQTDLSFEVVFKTTWIVLFHKPSKPKVNLEYEKDETRNRKKEIWRRKPICDEEKEREETHFHLPQKKESHTHSSSKPI